MGLRFEKPLLKLNPNGNLDKEFKREFFHAWVHKNGVWKLSIKTYSVVD